MKFLQSFFVIVVISYLVDAQGLDDVVGWEKIGSYYPPDGLLKDYFVPRHFKAQWLNARPLCKAYGFEILTLDTLAEMEAVSSMCERNKNMFGTYVHIGGIAKVGRSTSEWYWVTTNQKVSYNMPWASSQPDHYGGNEWCLTLAKNQGFKFNDINCHGSWEERFICQKKSDDLPSDLARIG